MAQIVRRLQGRRPCAHDMRQRTAADGDELVRPHIYIYIMLLPRSKSEESSADDRRLELWAGSGRGFKAPAPPPRYIKISTPGHAPPRPRTSHKTAPPSQAKPAETRHAVDKVARWLADLVHSSRRYKFETDRLEAPESRIRSRAFGKPTPKTTSAFFAGGAGLDGWPLARDVRRGRGARTSSGKGTGCRCDSRSGCRKGGRPSHHRPIQCDCDCGASGGPGTGS